MYMYYTTILKCIHKMSENDIETYMNSKLVPKGNFDLDYVLYISQITTRKEGYSPREVQSKNHHKDEAEWKCSRK